MAINIQYLLSLGHLSTETLISILEQLGAPHPEQLAIEMLPV